MRVFWNHLCNLLLLLVKFLLNAACGHRLLHKPTVTWIHTQQIDIYTSTILNSTNWYLSFCFYNRQHLLCGSLEIIRYLNISNDSFLIGAKYLNQSNGNDLWVSKFFSAIDKRSSFVDFIFHQLQELPLSVKTI